MTLDDALKRRIDADPLWKASFTRSRWNWNPSVSCWRKSQNHDLKLRDNFQRPVLTFPCGNRNMSQSVMLVKKRLRKSGNLVLIYTRIFVSKVPTNVYSYITDKNNVI